MGPARTAECMQMPTQQGYRETFPIVAVVVLAAGLSTRMGSQPKLLLDVGGMPMVRRTVRNALGIDPSEVVAVTGHRAEDIEQALSGLPVRCVFHPDYARGQQSSVATGVRSLENPCDAVMIMLGDQPLVTSTHLQTLVAAYANRPNGSILVPFHDGRRGNPILFAARHIPAVTQGDINIGCRKLIAEHPAEVVRFEGADSVFTQDCDTREDYERLVRGFAVA